MNSSIYTFFSKNRPEICYKLHDITSNIENSMDFFSITPL